MGKGQGDYLDGGSGKDRIEGNSGKISLEIPEAIKLKVTVAMTTLMDTMVMI
jgi:hypothetical protein